MDERERDDETGAVLHRFVVPEKPRTMEAIVVIGTLILLFALAYVLLGHPGPMRHAPEVDHARHSMNR